MRLRSVIITSEQAGSVAVAMEPGGTVTTLPVKNGTVNVLDVIAPAIAADLEAAGLKLAPFKWPVPAKPAKKG